ncbi:PTS sugar transporter subunit IIB [Fusobacterium sp.]|uniref:PTS sugar transporter subunit IIB n=1 Tax=Fusobacterium sp. TaxID=68766 RepID=UPI002609F321|nr:PTS sugar transporter subunit IIB [Fusobacterium sp.]
MKIMAVCGSGLGSSLMLEMNIKKVLKEIGIEAEVGHIDLASVKPESADIFVMSKSLIENVNVPCKIVLSNIISLDEIKEKLLEVLNK